MNEWIFLAITGFQVHWQCTICVVNHRMPSISYWTTVKQPHSHIYPLQFITMCALIWPKLFGNHRYNPVVSYWCIMLAYFSIDIRTVELFSLQSVFIMSICHLFWLDRETIWKIAVAMRFFIILVVHLVAI